eukprot:TRINITY_DN1721_c8_g3_i2.p2 TRINITY_DN1721_c8_g3~~TRINITY_DN1721_c8_g3_i2.p2  ORF type:complete len:287 (+),score=77.02 TRINITY_DN1721_c8_g3_i2:82-942(+)
MRCIIAASLLLCGARAQLSAQGSTSTAGSQTVAGGGATGTVTSSGFGGLQLGQGFLSEADCAALIRQNARSEVQSVLPCECRTYSRDAVPCHPNCCPRANYYTGSDRCHSENTAEWTVTEQIICRPTTTQDNYRGDGVCLYDGGNPFDVRAEQGATIDSTIAATRIMFTLSKKAAHRCHDLVLSTCRADALGIDAEMRFYTNRDSDSSSGVPCWVTCPPQPLSECTIGECRYNRGRTHPFVTEWLVPQLVSGSAYLLSCAITASGTSAGSDSINQTQFLPSAFIVP